MKGNEIWGKWKNGGFVKNLKNFKKIRDCTKKMKGCN